MLSMYRTFHGEIAEVKFVEPGTWIMLTDPLAQECEEVAEQFHVDIADVRAALDEEESSRIELEDGYTLILVDIPVTEASNADKKKYVDITIPLGIILAGDCIITVCTEETPILRQIIETTVKEFNTKKRMRFTYQILFRTAALYQTRLRKVNKRREEIEENVGENTEDVDLVELHELETALVYFATSLRANSVVLDRLKRYKRLEQYPEDTELLDDIIVETQQAIEMTAIYRDIINGTRELLSSVINNRLNNVMKYLTSITLVMAIPTIVSGIYGMNVDGKWMPLSSTPYGFTIICVIIAIACIIALYILWKKKLL